ncbi:MAG TPA: hypothetical protein VFQ47_05410 [Nitrososphaera sp.]|jgi:hypothetical protein|nr:hypothetical protein [Nitrososphaera sp.]
MNIQQEILDRLDSLIDKGNKVLGTHRPNPPNVIGFPTLNAEAFSEWQTQSLSYLINILGQEHIYVQKFKDKVQKGYTGSVGAGLGILRAVREDIEGGYLKRIEALVSADIFTDFLEMAEHLLEQGYKDPSASLIGAVLEDGLRKICVNHSITVKSQEDISSLNKKLADTQIYNRLMQKKVQVWNDIRNNADHGKFWRF